MFVFTKFTGVLSDYPQRLDVFDEAQSQDHVALLDGHAATTVHGHFSPGYHHSFSW
jgi:hypothetical protein